MLLKTKDRRKRTGNEPKRVSEGAIRECHSLPFFQFVTHPLRSNGVRMSNEFKALSQRREAAKNSGKAGCNLGVRPRQLDFSPILSGRRTLAGLTLTLFAKQTRMEPLPH